MKFYFALEGFLLVAFLCDAAVLQSRTYHNNKDIVVPLAIKRDDKAIKESAVDLKENETVYPIRNLETKMIAKDIASVVIDEAILQEGIKEAVKKEQDKEIIQTLEEEKKTGTSVSENFEIEAVIQPESNKKRVADVVREFDEALKNKLKTQHQILVIFDANKEFDDKAEETEGAVRQATSQQNAMQSIIFLNQFINQLYAQAADQANSDQTLPDPAPSRPGFFQQFAANLQEQESENYQDQISSEANDCLEDIVEPKAIIEVNKNSTGTETETDKEQEVENDLK